MLFPFVGPVGVKKCAAFFGSFRGAPHRVALSPRIVLKEGEACEADPLSRYSASNGNSPPPGAEISQGLNFAGEPPACPAGAGFGIKLHDPADAARGEWHDARPFCIRRCSAWVGIRPGSGPVARAIAIELQGNDLRRRHDATANVRSSYHDRRSATCHRRYRRRIDIHRRRRAAGGRIVQATQGETLLVQMPGL